jgi:hypothetical protein
MSTCELHEHILLDVNEHIARQLEQELDGHLLLVITWDTVHDEFVLWSEPGAPKRLMRKLAGWLGQNAVK